MADLKYYDVILKPIVTEKSMGMMEAKKYTFSVHPDATKSQVKEAVEKMFAGAKVKSVKFGLNHIFFHHWIALIYLKIIIQQVLKMNLNRMLINL